MRGLLLDTEENVIRKVEVNDLHDYYREMHCDCIDVTYHKLNGHTLAIVCDDNALISDKTPVPAVLFDGTDHAIFNSVIFTTIAVDSDDFQDLPHDLEDTILSRVKVISSRKIVIL